MAHVLSEASGVFPGWRAAVGVEQSLPASDPGAEE